MSLILCFIITCTSQLPIHACQSAEDLTSGLAVMKIVLRLI